MASGLTAMLRRAAAHDVSSYGDVGRHRQAEIIRALGRSEGQHLKADGTQRQLRWALEAVSAKAWRLPAKK
jgi:hypothetical protein